MPSINNLRGALLEEIVLLLLSRSGYRLIRPGDEGTRVGPAGLEVRGRGSWHQIDAFVAPQYAQPFIHPVRLLVEAKCYENRPVDIRILRSVVGTIVDINQNCFSQPVGGTEVQVQRFNYHAAVFSSSSYTEIAQQYAAAHQVFLIDYRNVSLMEPVIDTLMGLDQQDFLEHSITRIRQSFRQYLRDENLAGIEGVLSRAGMQKVLEKLTPAVGAIRGSYYGMIE